MTYNEFVFCELSRDEERESSTLKTLEPLDMSHEGVSKERGDRHANIDTVHLSRSSEDVSFLSKFPSFLSFFPV